MVDPLSAYSLLAHYGYFGLFALLALGIVGVPVPDETLITAAGFLLQRGTLKPVPVLIAALAGTLCGITCSYLIGRTAGQRVLGWALARLHLDAQQLERFQRWYEKRGHWTLILGYFVPGLRHVVAIGAGAARLSWRTFALFAYTGALLWVTTFLAAGYLFGDEWERTRSRVHIAIIGVCLGLVATLVVAGLRHRNRGSGAARRL